jgi:hypothetical protein
MLQQSCTNLLLVSIIILLIILFADFNDSTNDILKYYLFAITGVWLLIACNYDHEDSVNGSGFKSMVASAKNKYGDMQTKIQLLKNKLDELKSMQGEKLKQKCDAYINKLKSMAPNKSKDKLIQLFTRIKDGTISVGKGVAEMIGDILSSPIILGNFIAGMLSV